ncbi:gamma-glutamylcyclotransferase [Stappia sp. GBMRC 2046]|uniref:Gamma-glutamylcyclotransferase n=1 Tax=Stappia sediminis TaxID=2692190 RepID=A0A7X3LVE2_9HYPH|nr:gamma-glutamylcyclotransferase family protein [Stappia sediminis]MXN65809.1 gamma-glutamylcyclotransferase [Stappia sediminis]
MIPYFGYGSNMDLVSMRAKGVEPLRSQRASLRGWRLHFNVEHFFPHEGGMGNIVATGNPSDRVEGVLHLCRQSDLRALDKVEAYGIGYDRKEVLVETADGRAEALAYVGLPDSINDGCLPTRRYLNILMRGAKAAGVDSEYLENLAGLEVLPPPGLPMWRPPRQGAPNFSEKDLASRPKMTALAGAVFDMSSCRPRHRILWDWFGGRDVTLFHLRRLDTSDGSETLDDVAAGRLTQWQRQYLTDYLHAFSQEYEYVGNLLRNDAASCDKGREVTS